MRIAFISFWSCPKMRLGVLQAGGMNVYVSNLANQLGKLGHHVDIYTRAHRENHQNIIDIHPNVKIIHLPLKNRKLFENIDFLAKSFIDFTREQNIEYDILHAHYYYSGLIAHKTNHVFGKPLVVTFHTLAYSKELHLRVKDRERQRREQELINKSTAIISSTDLEKNELMAGYEINPGKIFVVNPGVNHQVFRKYDRHYSRQKLNLSLNKKILLFVGRIDPVKGINFLVEAVGMLKKKYPDFEQKFLVLLIGGDIKDRKFWRNPEVKRINHLIEKQDIACCVKFIGSQPHYLLPYFYSASDIVVMPSVYESFGLVVLEAMSSQSCILASRVGGLKYLIRDKINGRLFESSNIDKLCSLIWELLNDKEQREKLSRGAYLSSKNYSWKKQAQKTYSVYKKLL